jgi:transposase
MPMDLREAKALEIAARYRISFDGKAWTVPSQTGSGSYQVVLLPNDATCTCDDYTLRREACKHILAVRMVLERDCGGSAPAIDTDVLPVKKRYSQDWEKYNESQTQEKKRFQVLLTDLCGSVEEPKRPAGKTGRKPVPLADQLFSVCFKVYCTLSSRRFNCDLEAAQEKGYLSRTLHPNKINCFLEDPALTPFLKALIVRSSLPLKAVEHEFAVDSSGFCTSKFVRWFDHKYGVVRQEHDWVKVHIVTGVNTHVITAVAIYGRDAADSPIMPELVKQTAENFTIKEMSGDKAYLSVENVEAIFATGGIPFIAPRLNTTGAAGGLFEKMFHYYLYRKEDFLAHYHKRSNIESTFSSAKRKFGDSIRSRTPSAQVNEVLAKLVCSNLCFVILSQCELGIEATFWDDRQEEKADVLPLFRPAQNVLPAR